MGHWRGNRSRGISQEFVVVSSGERITMILGRDFQYKFGSTEFNWETFCVVHAYGRAFQ